MSDFANLDYLPPAAAPKADRPTFPCQSCAGTGRYRGVRVHQTESKCFACGGRGFFYQSHGDRMKARAKSQDRKQARLDAEKALFVEANPGLIEYAREISSWHDFASKMVQSFEQYGSLTPNQTSALVRSIDKVKASREAKQAERKEVGGTVDIAAIHKLFEVAKTNGLKRPIFRTEAFSLSLAPDTGRNPGAVYVKAGETYLGMLKGGEFKASRDATKETLAVLQQVATDPAGFAKAYGKSTGICCCCGRKLTDPVSVAAGIGPICAEGWGF